VECRKLTDTGAGRVISLDNFDPGSSGPRDFNRSERAPRREQGLYWRLLAAVRSVDFA